MCGPRCPNSSGPRPNDGVANIVHCYRAAIRALFLYGRIGFAFLIAASFNLKLGVVRFYLFPSYFSLLNVWVVIVVM